MIHLTVPGEPVGKGRPRFVRSTRHVYTPKKTVEYEERIRSIFMTAFPYIPDYWGDPVRLKITAHMTIPKSASKVVRAGMIAGEIRPTKTPDIDNIIKIVGDALNGLAFVDDKQIVSVVAEKLYSLNPRLEIEISKIGV